jgi:protein PhnA
MDICPTCGHEWLRDAGADAAGDDDARIVRDANGTPLADGDTVLVVKDLKVKGSSTTLKVGTRIKGIRLVDGDHEVDCRTDQGNYLLKACFLKKA